MDIYLPADFYTLRKDLHEWRDAGTSVEPMESSESHACSAIEPNGCADPSWRVF